MDEKMRPSPEREFLYPATEDLERLEVMEAYNDLIATRVYRTARRAGVAALKILDFGAGSGTLSVRYSRLFGVKPITCDIDLHHIEILKERGFTTYVGIDELPEDFDCIFASNVLEHIEDDVGTVGALKRRLRPGGCLFLLVPAFEALWTAVDTEVGHFRRYNRAELMRLVEANGLSVVEARYCDFLGFVAIALLKVLRVRREMESAGSLAFYDRWVLPLSRIADEVGLQHVCGRNVYVCARRL
jgi:SAM-dependent methyltransferase